MRELIVPDIHLRVTATERLLARWEGEVDRVVFLGDFFDEKGWGWQEGERDTPQGMVDWLRDSLERENRIHLLGNHDLSYRWPERHSCSGFDEETFVALRRGFGEERWRQMGFAVWTQGWLLSHAGLHRAFLEEESPESILEKLDRLRDGSEQTSDLLGVGASRGGDRPFGGVTWLDWRFEFEPAPGWNQVVGHTSEPEIARRLELSRSGELTADEVAVEDLDGRAFRSEGREKGSVNWCLDCGLQVIGLLEDGVLEVRRP